jgi:hypothetical protein
MFTILPFIRIVIMKYGYIYIIVVTIYYVCHMYDIHVYAIVPRQIAINTTLPIIPSTVKDIPLTDHNTFKHYSYHKHTLSLFYKKRREGRRHIR